MQILGFGGVGGVRSGGGYHWGGGGGCGGPGTGLIYIYIELLMHGATSNLIYFDQYTPTAATHAYKRSLKGRDQW